MGITPSSVTQNGVTATLTLSDSTVTVEVSSMSYFWRINGTNSGGDHGTYYIEKNKNASGSFVADDNHTYAFQVCSSGGDWSNGDFFTVTFDSGDDGEDYTTHKIHIQQGDGTELKVYRTWSDKGDYGYGEANGIDTGYVMSDGEEIWYPNDYFLIKVKALDGYELDTYTLDEYVVGAQISNLQWAAADPGRQLQAIDADDVYITSTATPIATVNIFNKNSSSWDKYAPYIYDKDSGWERYTPYIYNGSDASWDRYS